MTNDEIRAAIKVLAQRGQGELNATKCAIWLDLIDEAQQLLHGACFKRIKRTRAEIEADLRYELSR